MDALPVAPSVAVPIVTAPSLNATVPVGTPVAGATGRTVAVSVTACPTVDGFGEDVRLVVVDPRTKIFPVTLKRLVWTVLRPGPPTLGPLRLKKLVPSPTIACGMAGWPMYPAGGTDAAGSHWRNGPMLVLARASVKSQAGGAARQPWLFVKLIVPAADATNVWLPKGYVAVYEAPGTRPPFTRMRRRANTISAAAPSATVRVAPPNAPSRAIPRSARKAPPPIPSIRAVARL